MKSVPSRDLDSGGRGVDSKRRDRPFAGIAVPLPWWQRLLFPAFVFGLIGIGWQFGAIGADSLLIPTFSDTIAETARLILSSQLWGALVRSNQALVIGFAIALLIGIPGGLALGRFGSAERYVNPYLTILLAVPMAGVIPLLVMSIGIGLEAQVAMIVMFSVVVLIVNARAGVREASPDLIEMARSFGASELQIWRRILLPGALPQIMAGIRLGLGRAITGMVVAELLLVASGIGNLILQFQAQFEAAAIYATVIIVVAEALLLIAGVQILSRRFLPWVRRTG